MEELVELETQGWQALSTSEEAAKRFYSTLLGEDAIMLFPGGLALSGREKILESFGSRPWRTFALAETRVLKINERAAILIYRVSAERSDQERYTALVSSTYRREEGWWKLIAHQQTPC